jgi:peptidyl-prolyl cis-trans isomerase B (cyclophilin B)
MKKALATILVLSILLVSLTSLVSCEKVGTGCCELYGNEKYADHEFKYVKMTVKDHGAMIILLDMTNTPVTVTNFLKLVNEGFYDGLTFHRVMENFMIQGGDPTATGTGGSEDRIYGEFLINGHLNDIPHVRGVISMARSSLPDSASSQFFICNADARDSLDMKYAAFGYVIAGLSVVDSITEETVPYATGSSNTIPDKSKQAVIKSVVEITEEEALEYVK